MYRSAGRLLRVLFPLCVFFFSTVASAAVLRVSRGAPGPAHDGSSWQQAYTGVQAAITAAAPGDEVWVAAGTYGENIALKEGVSLYGGFAGTETERAQRNWNAHQSILDGGRAGSVLTASGAFTASTVVSGFVIRNGAGIPSTGGGMTLSGGADITVANNTFYRNSSARGGAMDIVSSSPRVANNVFLENSSSVAAAMYIGNASPEIVNNTFAANTAYNTSDPSNPVQRCAFLIAGAQAAPLFANNIETRGSGFEIDTADGSAPVFRNNCISGETNTPVFRPYTGSVAPADPTGSLGNIAVDPMFASWAHRNLHIQPASLCRGAGDATAVDASDVDMDGQPRLIDGHVDIGSDQSDGTMWTESPRVVCLMPTGNDLNDGRSWETAVRTIWEALKRVQAGDSIWVSAGTYDGSYVVIPNGVSVYGGFMGREKTLSERDPRANVTTLKGGVQVGESAANTQPTLLDGFTLTGMSGWGPAIQALGTATVSNNLITGIRMVDGYSAIGLFGAGTVLANNTIRGNSADSAFTALVSGGPSTIANNLIVANANGGISIGSKSDASPSTATVVNNTIASNGAEGAVVIWNAQSLLTLANNVIALNGLGVSAPSGYAGAFLRYNNCVYRNGTADWGGLPNPGTENGNIAVDPQFANLAYGDFRLGSASPCINSGNAAYVIGVTDAEGNARVVGRSVDMGALESTGQDPTPRATVAYVRPGGSDAGDGKSWTTAKATVKAALDLAALSGGEVWVAAGTYKENLLLPPFVSLYGGFIGTETQRIQRDPAAHETILDGQKRTTTLTIGAPGEGIEVDGFTIQNGAASYQHGGNVTLSGTRAAIRRCLIRNGVNTQGAGVYVLGGAPTIANCTFTANGTVGSCAVYVATGGALIANNVFDGQMTSQGYAIQAGSTSANVKVINNTVIRSKYAAVTVSGGTPTIANNILGWNGGGIVASGTVNPVVSHNCIWSSGTAYTGPFLGAGQASAYIQVNPTMADPTAGNVHIQPDSPCRDAGDNFYADPSWSDMDGQGRIKGDTVDIGADESTGTVWPAAPIYVRTDGDDAKDGRSWANARKTIAAGITAAKATLDAEVWVAAGTYKGAVSLQTGTAMYGGFAGTETQRSQRDWVRNVTTIDAAGATGNIVTIWGTPDAGGVLDGFTLLNSAGNKMTSGFSVTNCSPVIRHCTITGVKGTSYGAVYCFLSTGGSVTVEDCVISGNTAYSGAGLYANKGSVTILRTQFTDNTATGTSSVGGSGGAVKSDADHLTIQGCTFTGNAATAIGTSGGRGGAVTTTGSECWIHGNVFRGNRARIGGGVYQSATPTADQRIDDNTFLGNSADTGSAMAFTGPSAVGPATVVANNTIASNGGASGAVDVEQGGIVLANNILAFNTSGVYVPAGDRPDFRRNCFWSNGAFEVSNRTGAPTDNGNFVANPIFADLASGNVHIQPSSPCLGRADTAYVLAGETDVDGQPRVQGSTPDVGSDESDGTVWTPAAVVVRVTPAGDDANDGSSWRMSKKTIQAAVNSGAGEVWVAAGTYPESVSLRPFVYLYGGFSGREAIREQRDPKRNATVIDGEGKRWLIEGTDIAFGTIDGFALRNGYRRYLSNPSTPGYGGGVALVRCGVSVRNNTFLNNRGGSGGALYLNANTGEVARNRFQGNTAEVAGGGVYAVGTTEYMNKLPRIVDNVFVANLAPIGGGVHLDAGTLANNTFIANGPSPSSSYSYGAVHAFSDVPVIANNVFVGNSIAFTASYFTLTGPAFHHNCMYGNGTDYPAGIDLTGTNGNIRQDPMLADARTGNYHLLAGSPCIDAGDPAMTAPGDADVDGGARRTGATIDIGADEYDGRFTSPTPSAVIRVKPLGNDANDGASWAAAKRTVQAALDQAALTGGEVWVAGGVYSERVTVPPMVGLYGGFGGYEEQKSQRKWSFNTTILDGGKLGTVVTIPAAAVRAALDGFTIQNGLAKLGGGVNCAGGSAEITHNVFRANVAATTSGSAAGGGLYLSGATATISNNLFASNAATSAGATGGAVCVAAARVRFVNNTVVRNTAAGVGGGVRLNTTADALAVANNVFAYNSSALSTTLAAAEVGVPGNNCFFANVRDYDAGTDRTTVWGNIRRDPRFVDPYQDFHLRADSPCADAGDTSLVTAGAMDLSGLARVWGARVDMGAYESTTAAIQTGAAVVRVSPAGSDANDGSSWANAKRTIGAALAAVRSPGEVWVAAGTYQERVTVPSGVALLGGFTGTETVHTPADRAGHVTTLDGGQNGPVVVLAQNASASTKLEDLTITNGWYPLAGGVFCQSGTPALRRLVVTNNNAGGLYVLGGSPTVEDCTFGQASYITNRGGSPLIVRCVLNIPGETGLTMDGGSATVLQSTFQGCGVWATNAYLTMRNCEVRGASHGYTGGGVYLARGTIAMRDCVIAGNIARSDYGSTYGGGIYLTNAKGTLANNTIVGNGASEGGGIYAGASVVTLANNIVYGNTSGIAVSSSASGVLTLRNNCVAGNVAMDYSNLPDATGTNGNISADPKLQLPLSGPLHIQPGSPCRDAGNSAYVTAGDTDLEGQARIQGPAVDIGADESDGTAYADGAVPAVRVRPDGDDANDGSSWSAAKRTLQAAVAAAAARGGEVWASGTFTAPVSLLSRVAILGGFRGDETAAAQRDPEASPTVLDGRRGSDNLVTLPAGVLLCAVDGLTLQNAARGVMATQGATISVRNCRIRRMTSAGIAAPNSPVSIVGCRISGCYQAISAGPSSLIAGNRITGCSGGSSSVVYAWGAVRVVSNIIAGNATVDTPSGGGFGRDTAQAVVSLGSATGVFANNTVTMNEGPRGVVHVGRMTVENNIFSGNALALTFSTTPASLASNVFWNNDGDASGSLSPVGTHGNVRADPGFLSADAGDLRLTASSACVDAGSGTTVLGTDADADGGPRVQRGRVDIGALEWDGVTRPAPSKPAIYVSPTGDDAHDGSSWALAKRTLQAALDAGPADVRAKQGTYDECVDVGPWSHLEGGYSGTGDEHDVAAYPTTIRGVPGGAVVTVRCGRVSGDIDGFTVTGGHPGASAGCGVLSVGSTLTINRCLITGNDTPGMAGGGIQAAGSQLTVQSSDIVGNTTGGLYLYNGGAYSLVFRCRISDNVGTAVTVLLGSLKLLDNEISGNKGVPTYGLAAWGVDTNGAATVIANNLIRANEGGAIYAAGVSRTVPITGNTIVANMPVGGFGAVEGLAASMVTNNIIAGNVRGLANVPAGVPVHSNCVYNNTQGDYSGMADMAGTYGNIQMDPMFVSPDTGDYHLGPLSPCIDRGDSIAQPSNSDLDGNPRVQGAAVDLGAYETTPLHGIAPRAR